jgi:hypothetical protein
MLHTTSPHTKITGSILADGTIVCLQLTTLTQSIQSNITPSSLQTPREATLQCDMRQMHVPGGAQLQAPPGQGSEA